MTNIEKELENQKALNARLHKGVCDGYSEVVAQMRRFEQEVHKLKKDMREAKVLLEDWHKDDGVKQGHHPDEMCCDITEAIYVLERGK